MAKRITISVSDSVADKLTQISQDYGVTVSALGSISIMNYLEQRNTMAAMGDMSKFFNQLQQIPGLLEDKPITQK